MRHWFGHSKRKFSRLSGEVRGGHTPCTAILDIFFGSMMEGSPYPVPGRRNTPGPTSINRLVMISGHRAYLVYHIDECLRVIPKEAANHIARVLTREDLLNQGGEFVQGKRTSDQTFTGWRVEVGNEERVGRSSVFRTRRAKLKVYRSWIRRLRRLGYQRVRSGGNVRPRRG